MVLVALSLCLVHELALHLTLHLRHHGIDCLILGLHVHHHWLLLTRGLHHNLLSLHHGHLVLLHLLLTLELLLLLLLLWHERDLQGTLVVRVIDHVEHDIHVQLTHTFIVNKVLDSEHIKTHLLSLLQELFLDRNKVWWHVLISNSLSHRHLLLQLDSLCL